MSRTAEAKRLIPSAIPGQAVDKTEGEQLDHHLQRQVYGLGGVGRRREAVQEREELNALAHLAGHGRRTKSEVGFVGRFVQPEGALVAVALIIEDCLGSGGDLGDPGRIAGTEDVTDHLVVAGDVRPLAGNHEVQRFQRINGNVLL